MNLDAGRTRVAARFERWLSREYPGTRWVVRPLERDDRTGGLTTPTGDAAYVVNGPGREEPNALPNREAA